LSPRLLIAPKGGREIASSRYRVHDLVPHLERRGWSIEAMTPSMQRSNRATNAARDLLRGLSGADVLLVQRPGRRLEEEVLLRLAGRRSRLVAIDVDDPVAEHGAAGWATRRASVALVGSVALADRYAGRIPIVEVVPTSVDVGLYDGCRSPHTDQLVIGWIGDGPAYRASLVRLVGACASAPLPGRRLRVVGTKGDESLEAELRRAALDVPIELVAHIDWEDERAVARELAAFDVGLAPFRNREGASFKTVQYLAAGAVPVVEAGGEAEKLVRAALGEDCIVVRPGSDADVALALASLARPERRAELSRTARAAARRLFAIEKTASAVDAILTEALERTR
jgi:glycosyltransferase involved in cell wall biosynthesis